MNEPLTLDDFMAACEQSMKPPIEGPQRDRLIGVMSPEEYYSMNERKQAWNKDMETAPGTAVTDGDENGR